MVTILLVKRCRLFSHALAHLLDREPGLRVVAQVSDAGEVPAAAATHRPQLVLLDAALPEADSLIASLYDRPDGLRVLVLLPPGRTALLGRALPRRAPRLGFISTDATPATLMEGICRMVRGEAYLDPALAVAALAFRDNPLTQREREVLQLAASGESTVNTARKLSLAHGTVRNHISHALAKTGGRTKAEAVQIAEEAGWL